VIGQFGTELGERHILQAFDPSVVYNNRSYGLITIADAFETCQLGHRTDAATNQGVEAAAGSLDFLEQHRIGIGRPRLGGIDGEPHLRPAGA
jgi:hypothetical protein